MSNLIKAVIRADANYFRRNGFISKKKYDEVMRWLDGEDSTYARYVISEWLESDAAYFDELKPALLSFHWFLYPLMLLMCWAVPRKLRKYVAELIAND